MSKFANLMEAGRELSPVQVAAQIRALANDPRFAAVLALVERHHRSYTRAVGNQALAADHGKLAHCGGSVHASELLLASLQAAIEAKPKRRGQQQQPEGESIQ